MIVHVAENGQRVAFGTAESSEVKDGFVHFYDVHGSEVGRQPVASPAAPPPPPLDPPVIAAASGVPHDAT